MVCQEYCIILLCTAQVAEGLRGTPLQVHISGGCSSTRYTPQSWFERLGTETQDFGQLWSLKSLKISNAKQKLWFSQFSLGFLHSALTIWFWSKKYLKKFLAMTQWLSASCIGPAATHRFAAWFSTGSLRRESESLCFICIASRRLHPHGSPNEGETHSLCLEGVLSSRTWQKSSWNFQLGKESERNLRRKWASLFFYKEYEIISPWVFSRFLSLWALLGLTIQIQQGLFTSKRFEDSKRLSFWISNEIWLSTLSKSQAIGAYVQADWFHLHLASWQVQVDTFCKHRDFKNAQENTRR